MEENLSQACRRSRQSICMCLSPPPSHTTAIHSLVVSAKNNHTNKTTDSQTQSDHTSIALTYRVWPSWIGLCGWRGRRGEQEQENEGTRGGSSLFGVPCFSPWLLLTACACCLDMSSLLPGGFVIRLGGADSGLVTTGVGKGLGKCPVSGVSEPAEDINIKQSEVLMPAQSVTDGTAMASAWLHRNRPVSGWWESYFVRLCHRFISSLEQMWPALAAKSFEKNIYIGAHHIRWPSFTLILSLSLTF